MRSGCLDLAIRIVVASVAAVLTVLGVVLLFMMFIPSSGQPFDIESAAKVIGACVAAYCFYLVGKSVWKDIKRRRPPSEPRDPGSSGYGG